MIVSLLVEILGPCSIFSALIVINHPFGIYREIILCLLVLESALNN